MTRCKPYHTDSTEYPPWHRNVYHYYEECPDGKKIQKKHRKDGKGKKDLCDECEKLDTNRDDAKK
jgi:hypothetical protein